MLERVCEGPGETWKEPRVGVATPLALLEAPLTTPLLPLPAPPPPVPAPLPPATVTLALAVPVRRGSGGVTFDALLLFTRRPRYPLRRRCTLPGSLSTTTTLLLLPSSTLSGTTVVATIVARVLRVTGERGDSDRSRPSAAPLEEELMLRRRRGPVLPSRPGVCVCVVETEPVIEVDACERRLLPRGEDGVLLVATTLTRRFRSVYVDA